MPAYTPPALNAVDFALSVQPSHSVVPAYNVLVSYTVPALNAVDFALVSYSQPVYNTIDFEVLDVPAGGTTVDTLTGALTLTGFSPSIGKGIFTGVGALTLTGYAPTVVIAGEVPAAPKYYGVEYSKGTYKGSARAKPSPGKFGGLVKYVWTGKGRVPKKR